MEDLFAGLLEVVGELLIQIVFELSAEVLDALINIGRRGHS